MGGSTAAGAAAPHGDRWLEGRVAVVSGAARGIGEQVADAFAAAGARVLVADLGAELDGTGRDDSLGARVAERLRAGGADAWSHAVDVTRGEEADELVQDAVDRWGRLDVVVNAAGILRQGDVGAVTDDDLTRTMAVHLGGAINLMRAARAYWSRHPGTSRRVVNIGSESGMFGDPQYIAYAAAKAAVHAATLSAVDSLGAVGATVNVFVPQAATRMTASIPAELLSDAGTDKWSSGGEYDPRNVTPALVYLASTRSDWLTGATLGGWGFEVHRYAGPARHRSAHSAGPWDLDELFARLPGWFGGPEAAVGPVAPGHRDARREETTWHRSC